jgi:hypothetical protein
MLLKVQKALFYRIVITNAKPFSSQADVLDEIVTNFVVLKFIGVEMSCRYIYEYIIYIKHFNFDNCNNIRVICYLFVSYCLCSIFLCLWLVI